MKEFNLIEAKIPKTKFCTRCYNLKAEIISFNDKTYNSNICKRPIKYKVKYSNGKEQILYCDTNGRCNSNKYIIVNNTHDLMIDNK